MNEAKRTDWHYTTTGNGETVTVHAPDGRTAFLQGDDAVAFMDHASKTNERFTDADLCMEYEDLVEFDCRRCEGLGRLCPDCK